MVVFLNFWFTRCQPCIEEWPLLNKLVSDYKKEKIIFLSFANEDSLVLNKFLKATKFDFKIVPNGATILTGTFKLFAVWPTNVIIDKQSKIRFIQSGKLGDNQDDYKKVLEEAFK